MSTRNHRKRESVIVDLVEKLPLDDKLEKTRNGIILYTIHQKERVFLVGIDSKTHDITDFGGGYEKSDGDRVNAAIREFNEETLNIIQGVTPEKLRGCMAICDRHNLIIFVPIDLPSREVVRAFERAANNYFIEHDELPEVCSVTWLTQAELVNCITRREENKDIIYDKVGKFLRGAGDFFQKL